MHAQLKKYLNRMPASLVNIQLYLLFVREFADGSQLFTILPQVVARICHPNRTIYDLLTRIVARAVSAFPQQGLWTILAVVKSSSKDRASRGIYCLHKITVRLNENLMFAVILNQVGPQQEAFFRDAQYDNPGAEILRRNASALCVTHRRQDFQNQFGTEFRVQP